MPLLFKRITFNKLKKKKKGKIAQIKKMPRKTNDDTNAITMKMVIFGDEPSPGRRKFCLIFNSVNIHCDCEHIKIRISQSHLNILRIKWNLCAHKN